jgi:hypothetical protein
MSYLDQKDQSSMHSFTLRNYISNTSQPDVSYTVSELGPSSSKAESFLDSGVSSPNRSYAQAGDQLSAAQAKT